MAGSVVLGPRQTRISVLSKVSPVLCATILLGSYSVCVQRADAQRGPASQLCSPTLKVQGLGALCEDTLQPAGTAKIDPAERAAFQAFYNEENVDAKIHLGEEFDRKYPNSRYEVSVDSALTSLYYNKQDWPKFYATGEKVIAKSPKNLGVLELVGWAIPRNSSADLLAKSKLNEAIDYEKRALKLIAAMKKPKEIDQQDFDSSIEGLSWRAYSGLGLAHFRQNNYADSAAELQIAVRDEAPEPDAGDLLALGIDLENLNRKAEATAAFSKCAQISGDLQDVCQQDLQKAKIEETDSAEDQAYQAFEASTNRDTQTELGEKFDQTYPASPYEERVDTALADLYRAKQNWDKFYATAERVLEKDPNNVPMLTMEALAISRNYDVTESNGPARLDQAEKYDQRALQLLPAMQQPTDLTTEQFARVKQDLAAQAHSGLGVIDFRRSDFEDSAKELQLATADVVQVEPFDLYLLGIDLQKLNRSSDAAEAFRKCSAIGGNFWESQCKRDAEKTSQAANQLLIAASASIPPVSSSNSIGTSNGNTQSSAPIRSQTIEIPVRVVVRNKDGRPLRNLTKQDFKLYQDGKLQAIVNFTGVAPASAQSSSESTATHGVQPLTKVEASSAAAPDRFIALFFDDYHIKTTDLMQIRNAAFKYLSSLQPSDRVSIATVSSRSNVDYTADRDKLRQALLGIAPAPVGQNSGLQCPPMDYGEAEAIEIFNLQQALDLAVQDTLVCQFGGDSSFTSSAVPIVHSTARQILEQNDAQTEIIFDQIDRTIRRLSVLPGEREVVFVSPGFVFEGHEAELDGMIGRALQNSIVVNTLDPEGMATYIQDASTPTGVRARSGSEEGYLTSLRRSSQMRSEMVLSELSDATGGLFFHNNNDLTSGLRELASPAEFYYLLSYSPEIFPVDGKYHTIRVAVSAKAVATIQARHGFYAPSHLETPAEAARREIANAVFSDDEQHDLPVKFEASVTRAGSGQQEVSVKAEVDPTQLRFNKNSDRNNEDLTVSAALFSRDGNYVSSTEKTTQMNLDDSTLAGLDRTGFYVGLDLSVKPGDYIVRIVARDSNDGHISAQSVPITVPN